MVLATALKPKTKKKALITVSLGKTSIQKSKKSLKKKLNNESGKDTIKDAIEASKPAATEPSAKTKKYIMPSKSVTEDLVTMALKALQKVADHYKKGNKIFEEEAPVFLQITPIKIQNMRGNIKFKLPHSTVASTGEVCLITKDMIKGKKPDHEPTVDRWEEILKKAGVTKVKTVLPMRQLRVEYDQYELKRRLLTQHDFIMVDTRVLNHVSHILGKQFFKKHNMLVPVRLDEENDIKKNIDGALKTVMLRLSEGPTSTIVLGHMGMTLKELKDNVLSFVKQLAQRFPGGEANVRTLAVKLPLSLSLPLYVTLRSKSTVQPPKIRHDRSKDYRVVEDELSTIPGGTVTVTPEGVVTLKRRPENNDLFDSDVDEEPEKTKAKSEKANDSEGESE